MPDMTKEEEELLKLEPNLDDFMGRRLHHHSFQKTVYWLDFKSKNGEFVYANELSAFMKITSSRAYQILNELCMAGLMSKKITGNIAEYHFVKNGGHTLLNKYVEKAKKLLGLI